jgi:hypothetical protein
MRSVRVIANCSIAITSLAASPGPRHIWVIPSARWGLPELGSLRIRSGRWASAAIRPNRACCPLESVLIRAPGSTANYSRSCSAYDASQRVSQHVLHSHPSRQVGLFGRCGACFSRLERTAPRFIFSAHASGVAHGSASASIGSAPRSNRSVTNSARPQRHAHPSGVLRSRSSRASSLAPASRRIVAKPMRSAAPIGADSGQAAATS